MIGKNSLMGLLPGEHNWMQQGQMLEQLLGNPLLHMGTGLLSASGYSDRPVSFGEAMGKGLEGFSRAQQFRDQKADREQNKRWADAKIKNMEQRTAYDNEMLRLKSRMLEQQMQNKGAVALRRGGGGGGTRGAAPEPMQTFMDPETGREFYILPDGSMEWAQ